MTSSFHVEEMEFKSFWQLELYFTLQSIQHEMDEFEVIAESRTLFGKEMDIFVNLKDEGTILQQELNLFGYRN